ncbi:MAG: histidine phosphatase family protein [Candidatus Melainabacteria bacterium]|nr:histidine phosphatase family protein [Candidatus Melainabacteria bacterium]
MHEIFILRHGHAEDTSQKGDFYRKLIKEGKEKVKKLGLFFNNLNEELNLVLTSPLIRAKETAEIFINNIQPKPNLKTVDFLSCGASSTEIVRGLLPFSQVNKILLIGHAPDLENFLGRLIGAKNIKLKKGALAKVILNNGIELSGELEWLIIPKLINATLKINLEKRRNS